MKAALLTLVACTSLASASAFAAAEDDLAIGIHASILEQAIEIAPQRITTPIERYVAGVYTNGVAVTSANVALSPSPRQDAVSLALTMSSYTNAATYSSTWPRPSILVEFNASIDTWATTWTAVLLSEPGFAVMPAASAAQSVITFYNLETSSWGLFWRLKERIAYEQAMAELMAQKAQQEAQASAQVAGQLNATVDQKTRELLAPLQTFYRDSFYQPVIVGGGMQGKMQFATTAEGFSIRTRSAAPLALVSRDAPLEARVGGGLVSRALAAKLAGRTYTGAEVFFALAGDIDPAELGDAVDVEALRATKWQFAASDAVRVEFTPDAAEFVFAFDALSRGTQRVSQVEVTVPAALFREDGVDLLDLDQDLKVRSTSAATLSAAEIETAKELVRLVIPPVTLELTGRKVTIGALALKLAAVEAEDGALHLVLAAEGPAPGGGTGAGGATPTGLGAWCTAAGGTFRGPDGEGHSSCDCGSLWIRDDAMQFYGEPQFAERCRAAQ